MIWVDEAPESINDLHTQALFEDAFRTLDAWEAEELRSVVLGWMAASEDYFRAVGESMVLAMREFTALEAATFLRRDNRPAWVRMQGRWAR